MATLLHAIETHAKDKSEIIIAIMTLFLEEEMSLNGWVLWSINGGAGSYCLISPDKKQQFHFRNGGRGQIAVYDLYHYKSLKCAPVIKFDIKSGNQQDIQRMRVSVRRWLRSIS
jgi:hypothetical protein